MNKVTKGTLAAAAAGALLLGGAGTYAVWSDEEALNAGNVSTGSLTLQATSGGWSYDGGITIWDDADTLGADSPVIVPGDTLTSVYTVAVDTTGDNIEAELALVGETGTLPTGVDAEYVVSTTETPDMTAELVEDGAVVNFPDAADYDFTVKVVLTFSADLDESQLKPIDLAGAKLTLTQS